MGVEFLAVPEEATVEEALRRIRRAENIQPEALLTTTRLTTTNACAGRSASSACCTPKPETPLSDIMDADPVRVTPDTDVVDVTILMADYNLMTVPVVDVRTTSSSGVITVDDVLEATIPDDWRRREPPPHPEPRRRHERELQRVGTRSIWSPRDSP